jgi:hypothetical protein
MTLLSLFKLRVGKVRSLGTAIIVYCPECKTRGIYYGVHPQACPGCLHPLIPIKHQKAWFCDQCLRIVFGREAKNGHACSEEDENPAEQTIEMITDPQPVDAYPDGRSIWRVKQEGVSETKAFAADTGTTNTKDIWRND